MKKIRMNLDDLDVQTFETGSVEPERGTIRGHWSQVGTCDAFVATCQPNGTCARTCGSRCTGTACL